MDLPPLSLAAWLEVSGIKPAGLAKLVPCRVSTITRILKGERRPWKKTARRISEVTGNRVPVEAILSIPAAGDQGQLFKVAR